MWNKNYSHLVLVKIKLGSWKFTLPVPLFIFDDLLKASLELALFFEWIFPRQKMPRTVINVARLLIGEIRDQGRWELADISVYKNQVSISFY